MLDYAEYLRTIIARRDYVLEDMEERINRLWIEGKLTNEQRDQLIQLAADNARDSYQIDVVAKLADLEQRVWELEHPVDQYVIWMAGYQTKQHEIVRYDVTGDGELDLCQYNGGRASTALSIGKIEGWNMLDRELNVVATITRDADGGYVVTPINDESGQEDEEGDEEGAEQPTEPEIDYESMTKAQLIELAEQMGVSVSSSMTKAQIIAALRGE